jgi:epoxyqueuosine reductase
MTLTDRIKEKAVALGFDLVGIAPAQKALHAPALKAWLAQNYHGSMEWLTRNPEGRADPRLILEGAQSVVVVGMSYFQSNPPPEIWNDPLRGRIARYAWGRDYHKIMQPKLRQLAAFMDEEAQGSGSRSFVDFGPVLEHDAAAQAGIGFTGKHSLTIHPGRGSYFFLGEVITTAELELNPSALDQGASWQDSDGVLPQGTCGSCVRCLNVCPTHAFPAAYVLDGSKCISYLTIELRGSIPVALRPKMKNWIFGCDECQEVCPWVQRITQGEEPPFELDAEVVAPRLPELLDLDADQFLKRFAGRPVMRTKWQGMLRNAAVALGNSGEAEARAALERHRDHTDEVIREHVRWGLGQLEGQGPEITT